MRDYKKKIKSNLKKMKRKIVNHEVEDGEESMEEETLNRRLNSENNEIETDEMTENDEIEENTNKNLKFGHQDKKMMTYICHCRDSPAIRNYGNLKNYSFFT